MLDINRELLTGIVRKAQLQPELEILDWTVETLSNRGANSPEGLLRLKGQGRDEKGLVSWSIALKILNKPNPDVNPTAHEPSYLINWQREALLYRSGLLNDLPGPIRPVTCYGVTEQPDSVWLWLELLDGRSERQWGLDDYAFAADQIGRFNAASLTMETPSAPWLARNHTRAWTSLLSFESAWEDPQVRQHFKPQTQTRLEQLWSEREHFFNTLDKLPQVFSHFDYKSNNLFLQPSDQAQLEVVAVDWGDCGIAALGGDLVFLVGGSTAFFDWEPSRVVELHEAVVEAYSHGLVIAGYDGDPRLAQLSYLTWLAMHFAPPIASFVSLAYSDGGRETIERVCKVSPEHLLENLPLLCEFALDCADEARKLMRVLP